MFVHASYQHLLGNLQSLVNYGFPVYDQFGPSGLYFVFLGGGILSSDAISPLVDSVWANGSSAEWWFESGKDVITGGGAGSGIKGWWAELSTVANSVGNIGSSGGVSALYGCASVVAVRAVYLALRDLICESSEESRLAPSVKLLGCLPVVLQTFLFLGVCRLNM
jgi:membrane associated rhomboid family serine protease